MQIPDRKHCRANLAQDLWLGSGPGRNIGSGIRDATVAHREVFRAWGECTPSAPGQGTDNTNGAQGWLGTLPTLRNPACGNAMRRLLDANNAVSTSWAGLAQHALMEIPHGSHHDD